MELGQGGGEKFVDLEKLGGEPSFQVEVTGDQDSKLGGMFGAKRVKGNVLNIEGELSGHEVNLVKKWVEMENNDCFGNENTESSNAERYMQRWLYLKSVGIPVARSMRIVDDTHIVMGDMTIDGSVFVGKGWVDLLSTRKRGSLSDVEKKFLDIDVDLIKKEVVRIDDLARSKGIRLPYDDPFDILMHPDGSFEVVVMDLTAMELVNDKNIKELDDDREKMMNRVDNFQNAMRSYADR